MAMSIGNPDGDDEVIVAINTTPLVDVMLVLLIIFLITIPVVTHTVPVQLPKEVDRPLNANAKNINLAIDTQGHVFWNLQRIDDMATLTSRLRSIAALKPQPEVDIRGDREARYAFVGRVLYAAQRAGIARVGFIVEPPAHGD